MFYRANVRSYQELEATVREVLTQLKEEIRKRANVERPVPQGPSKAIISGARVSE
jgi:hypothetical protein